MICGHCREDKNPDDFSFKNVEKRKKHSVCKECHSRYRQQHYLNNKAKYIAKALKWNSKQGEFLKKFLFERLSDTECVDCGEKDILVLDFDHKADKRFGIAEMFKRRYSVHAVETELLKCEVRCANCHRRKTAKQSGYWKYKLLNEIKLGA